MPKNCAFLNRSGLGAGIRNRHFLDYLRGLGLNVVYFGLDDKRDLSKRRTRNPLGSFGQSASIVASTWISVFEMERSRIPFDIIHAEGSHMGHIARLFAQRHGTDYVLDLHGLWSLEFEGQYGRRGKRTASRMDRWEQEAVRKASHLIVVSEEMRRFVMENLGISSNKITVVQNGCENYSQRAHYAVRQRAIYGGAFTYWERIGDFIGMAARDQQHLFDFTLVGDGPEREKLLAEMASLNSPYLTYLGPKSREETRSLFADSQIGVCPSSDDIVRRVAWPVKVMEYASLGLPIVAPLVGDWGRLIRQRSAGSVSPTDDPTNLYSAARELSAEKDWTRASLNALELARGDYAWDNLLHRLDDVYSEYR